MPKKYQYSVVLFEIKSNWYTHINVTLDHPMTETDLSTIEIENSPGFSRVVTNWKLINVTGTFAYRLIVSFRSPLGNIYLKSLPWTLGHKITAITIEKDYETIYAQLDNLKVSIGISGVVEILFHQEIPDE